MAIVSLRTLSHPDQAEPALALFGQLLSDSIFPSTSIERIRAQLLRALEQDQQQPGRLVSQRFFTSLFGDHPYAHDSKGTPDSLKRLQRADLIAFYQRHYVARNLVIAMVGDVSREQAEQIATRIDAALPAGEPAPPLSALQAPQQAVLDTLNFLSNQAHLMVGSTGVARGDPRWYALTVGNEIFGGGGFSSRLNQLIRQDHGLAYSVYSQFSPMAVPGPFIMGLQTRADQAEQALSLLKTALREFIEKGPTDQEVKDAKERIINRFPLSIANNSSIIDNLGAIGFYDLPLSYLNEYQANIGQVTQAQIQAAFAELINPDHLLTVVLKPPATEPETSNPEATTAPAGAQP
jgi:zinc protease